jgi:hypothetical protein
MAMDDAPHIRPFLEQINIKPHFARGFVAPLQDLALSVDEDDVPGFIIFLAETSGGDEDNVLFHPAGEVPANAGDKTLGRQPMANFGKLPALFRILFAQIHSTFTR